MIKNRKIENRKSKIKNRKIRKDLKNRKRLENRKFQNRVQTMVLTSARRVSRSRRVFEKNRESTERADFETIFLESGY